MCSPASAKHSSKRVADRYFFLFGILSGIRLLAAAALTDETWKEVKAAADVWVAATPGMFEVLSRLLRAATD